MKPWKIISPDDIDVVAPDGSLRCRVKGYFSGEQFIIDDMSADVREGDEIRRLLPNGREEAFLVVDPKFFKNGSFGSHYQVAVRRRGEFGKHAGGNYTIHVSGNNARVNVGSTDNSANSSVVQHESLGALSGELTKLREVIAAKAHAPEHYVAVGALASAELAAKEGDEPKAGKALAALGIAGHWVLDTAKEIGVKLAAEMIKQRLGLPPG